MADHTETRPDDSTYSIWISAYPHDRSDSGSMSFAQQFQMTGLSLSATGDNLWRVDPRIIEVRFNPYCSANNCREFHYADQVIPEMIDTIRVALSCTFKSGDTESKSADTTVIIVKSQGSYTVPLGPLLD